MKRVRMAPDESLVQEVDRSAHAVGITRSDFTPGFTRDALHEALGRLRERELERWRRAGYEKGVCQLGCKESCRRRPERRRSCSRLFSFVRPDCLFINWTK